MGLRFLFVMDPMPRINIDTDSTFVLMLEAERRGHALFFAEISNLEQAGCAAYALATEVTVRRVRGDHFAFAGSQRVRLDDFDAVFMRKDPPVDLDYLVATYILDAVDRSRVVLVNDSRGIRDWNEKIAATRWSHFMPTTLVASDRARIRRFIDEIGSVVVKPLHLAGGSSVFLLHKGDRNIGSTLDLITREGRTAIMAQEYLPNIVSGDKRIILLDGDPIGAVNRRPKEDDLRANLHVGGVAESATITDRDREICASLRPELVRCGLVFVGIDVIDGRLTEINVTSPTGLQEIDRFNGVCLEAQIMDWVERRRADLGSSV